MPSPVTFDHEERTVWLTETSDLDIYQFFRTRSFRFSDSDITAYCLSLATKPFVILTGISGTGKTKIAQIFADYLTQDVDEQTRQDRIAFVSVRPDWMDNRGLLGFYNPITEKYQAPQVLRLLLAAKELPNEPHVVILDEMNLAKVEYYFSDFLSVLESRTPGHPRGVPLRLHDQRDVVSTEDGLMVPRELEIPSNVIFTGTVNVDETTYMFSPKVLDRANVMEFNEVVLTGYGAGRHQRSQLLFTDANVRAMFDGSASRPFCTTEDFETYRQLLESLKVEDPLAELFQRLVAFHLHFGYRVINEISRFVVLASKRLLDFDLHHVVDVQILQKVLPKFHGTRGKLLRPLEDILAFCYEKPAGDGNDAERRKMAVAFDPAARYPRTAQKVGRMLADLEEQGYTSFIQ